LHFFAVAQSRLNRELEQQIPFSPVLGQKPAMGFLPNRIPRFSQNGVRCYAGDL